MKNTDDDTPSPQQQAFDDGRYGYEMWNHYYRSGDEDLLAAYCAGAAICEKHGPPLSLSFPFGNPENMP